MYTIIQACLSIFTCFFWIECVLFCLFEYSGIAREITTSLGWRKEHRFLSVLDQRIWAQFLTSYGFMDYDITNLEAIRQAKERKCTLESLSMNCTELFVFCFVVLRVPWVIQIPQSTHQKWKRWKKKIPQSVSFLTKASQLLDKWSWHHTTATKF